jgi:hypothetical protein
LLLWRCLHRGWWLQSYNDLQSCHLYLNLLNQLPHLGVVLQQCQLLDVSSVHALLEGSGLRLRVEDPLQMVSSLQLPLEPPSTKPVVLLLSLEESEALLLVGR